MNTWFSLNEQQLNRIKRFVTVGVETNDNNFSSLLLNFLLADSAVNCLLLFDDLNENCFYQDK